MGFVLNQIQEIGSVVLYVRLLVQRAMKNSVINHDTFEQTWKVTTQSLPTTALAGFFVGAIMTIQFTMQVKQFGALGFLGGLATSGTVREIGPLLIAFMLSGKVGAYTSAELGTMRVTEQIDALRCLGADPIVKIILPRFVAIIFSSFFLLMAGLMMSVFGGMATGYVFAGIESEEYVRHIPTIVNGFSILVGLVNFSFSVLLATLCTYKGFYATGGAQGVGRAVVSTAVSTMVYLVVLDWLTSFLAECALQAAGVL